MKIIIKYKDRYSDKFIYEYIPKLIKYFSSSINYNKLNYINEEFNINSRDIINNAINNLLILVSDDNYIITTNKNIKIDNYSIEYLLGEITYGNRSVKGDSSLYNIFKVIERNIDYLYKEWQENN